MAFFGSDFAFDIKAITFIRPIWGDFTPESLPYDTTGGNLPPLPVGTETKQR
jgi:hypothetical protein